MPEADILRVAFGPVFEAGDVAGFSLTFTLAGAVSDEYVYQLNAYLPNFRCGFELTYRPPITQARSHSCQSDTVRLPDASVQGTQVTIVVPLDLLPRGVDPGDTLGTIDAYTFARMSLPPFGTQPRAPKLDYASSSKTYVIPR